MSRLERERTFHNAAFTQGGRAVVDKYYAVTARSRGHYLERLEALAAHRRVLEYGCATGSTAFHLAGLGAEVLGIDIADQAIALARDRARAEGLAGRCTFRVMDAEQLELPDASFDVVCGTGILHHLDLERAFAEIARVLTPEGTALFIEPLGHNPLLRLYRRLTPSLRTVDEHPLLARDLASAEAHFLLAQTTAYHLQSLAAVPLRGLPGFAALVRALDAADALAFRLWPALQRQAWQVVLELSRPRVHAPARRFSLTGGQAAAK